ncbi:MAG TPA: glucose-1-phosphate adenylyltransferase subunit GlgD, partial [Clostridia bacterium]|nr:glucose-1-phosphate adenylyltransferase subunit GlgD [Clostridia bacterium]
MKNVMGLIYTGENDARLRELTLTRAIAALPVAGRFRMIDFLMSSMVHSGIRNVGVITQKNYHSLMDHLGSGKEWDLHLKNDGLFILPPFLTRDNVGIYTGMLDALRSNTGYLRRSRQEYVLLSNSHILFNTNFTEMIAQHIQSGADITMLYARRESKDLGIGRDDYAYLSIGEDQRVTDIEINPSVPSYPNELLEVYLMKRELLRYLVDQAVAHGMHHFRRDIIQRLVNEGSMVIRGYAYEGFFWRIDSVQAYFEMNRALLDSAVRKAVFVPELPVYTKVRDDMAAHYGPEAKVINSLIADGSQIDGYVENSVLFRGVRVEKDAVVRNSIIM